MSKREIRYLKQPIELRAEDGKAPMIAGYAAVFAPCRSEDLGGFVEQIDEHAFDEAVGGDVRALFNHDPSKILGRTKSGTLRLSCDSRGLRYEVDAPDTQAGRDTVTSIKRGDVDGSSFGFYCKRDSWEKDHESGQMVRTVLEADVFDVSPVTFPAYPDATSSIRALFPDGQPEPPKQESPKPDPTQVSEAERNRMAMVLELVRHGVVRE